MKRIVMLMIFAVLAGLTLNCSNPPIPQNAFRVKTRGKFHLFGIPLPFSIPVPNIAINIKTTVAPNAPGTTGSVPEFATGGGFVSTDGGGKFDAVNAVIPAPYNAKIAPGQSLCSAPTSSVFPFYAVNGGTYKIQCRYNIQVTFLVDPGYVDISTPGSGGNTVNAINVKGASEKPVFLNAQNLKVQYYRQESGEDYVLESVQSPLSVSADGTELLIPVPNHYGNFGIHYYRILIVEDGTTDTYLGHGELSVDYPAAPTPTPTPCPPDLMCECPPDTCS